MSPPVSRACTLLWVAPHGMTPKIEVVPAAAWRQEVGLACEAKYASTCGRIPGGLPFPTLSLL